MMLDLKLWFFFICIDIRFILEFVSCLNICVILLLDVFDWWSFCVLLVLFVFKKLVIWFKILCMSFFLFFFVLRKRDMF